jgi:hypothetical protein
MKRKYNQTGGIVYEPLGLCMYCGSTNNLTREHMFPFGMFGDLIFPKSSCVDCARITSSFETYVLKDMFGLHREKLNFRSSNSNKRRKNPIGVAKRINQDGSEDLITLEKYELPFLSFALPKYDHPSVLLQTSSKEARRSDRFSVQVGKDDASTLLSAGGGRRPVRAPQMVFHPEKFCRFLAKVAHSFAVATLGDGSFRPFLRDFIRTGSSVPRFFVGGETDLTRAEPCIFEICLGTLYTPSKRPYLGAKIRLFSYMRTPTYVVVVGQHYNGILSDVPDAAYARHVKIRVMGDDGAPIFSIGEN